MTTKTKPQDKHKMSEIDENISKLFDVKKRLGKGAYGIVWKALDKRTNDTLAVKKIFDAFRDETDAQRTFREIIFLKAFRNHPNVIRLLNVYKATNNLDIYLIFEYMESDLHNIIKKGTILKDIHKRYVMYQLINAIKYIHSGNVIHRDLKPSNVLVDSKCRCKLADFGLARSVPNYPALRRTESTNEPVVEPLLTDYVATRWYRAPEILIASKTYTKGIDMWSLGCILGEMIRGKPLFQGSSTINQIEKIVTALPNVTEQDINAVGAGFGSILFSKQISRDSGVLLDELLSDAPHDAVDMVKSLLVLDPLRRLTAKEALSHRYVEKFRNTTSEIELKMDVLPPFRDDVRLTVPEYRSKLYEIAQKSMEKHNKLLVPNMGYDKNAITKREHKLQYNQEKVERNKDISKNKHFTSLEEKYNNKEKYMNSREQCEKETLHQNSIIVNKPLKKTASPVHKREINKTKRTAPNDLKQLQQWSEKTKTNYHASKNKTNLAVKESLERSSKNYMLRKRNSIECSDVSLIDSNLKSHNITHNIHQPVSEEECKGYPTKDMLECLNQSSQYDIRNIKSDVIPNTTTSSLGKKQERLCYERRLKKLEEEIEKYKMEVKSFCTETYRYTHPVASMPPEASQQQYANSSITKKASTLPTMTANNAMTPKKNNYLHLFSKGNRDFVLSDFDITSMGACSSTGGSGDHIGRFCNSNNNSKSNLQDYKSIVEIKLSQNNARAQNQHRIRSTPKYLSRPQTEG